MHIHYKHRNVTVESISRARICAASARSPQDLAPDNLLNSPCFDHMHHKKRESLTTGHVNFRPDIAFLDPLL
jgi:hypothetical protein